LKNRIIRASKENQDFLIIVVLPLLPSFQGDITKKETALLRTVLKFQQESIAKGSNSLFKFLEAKNINPHKYIRFYGLRNHDIFNDTPVQEIIYVHSKLMIVDDRRFIIGSANINDRSLLGDRDSEIAIVVEDAQTFESNMAGKTYRVGKVAYDFRINIFKEHFGIDDENKMDDPLNPKFLKSIEKHCKINTDFYWDVFRAEPDDRYRTYADVKQGRDYITKMDPEKQMVSYNSRKETLKGFYVEYPTYYLDDESLELVVTNVANLIPVINFV
jgi:phospholipase D1/2